jgi:iron only hydrogenase large subunit-like protein
VSINDETKEESVKLSFAKAYGFRHIQNVVRRLQQQQPARKQQKLHFIEVMACPSGCVNGGGQLRATTGGNSTATTASVHQMKALVRQVDAVYRSGQMRSPENNPLLGQIYNDWLLSSTTHLHTTYEDVKHSETAEASAIINW